VLFVLADTSNGWVLSIVVSQLSGKAGLHNRKQADKQLSQSSNFSHGSDKQLSELASLMAVTGTTGLVKKQHMGEQMFGYDSKVE
jgi:hypothetical protein